MPEEITMPKLSDTMEEGTVLKWLKNEGDYVQQGEPLFEVETDKAVMEVEAFVSGVLSNILVQEGENAPVGTPIAVIGGEVGKVVPHEEPLKKAAEKGEEAKEKPVQVIKEAPKLKVVSAKAVKEVIPVREGVNTSPAARSYAKQRGIDLSQVAGTGEGGVITLNDVRNFREQKVVKEGPLSLAQREILPHEEITNLSRMRKAIAATVSYSKQHIPHFYVTYEIDMTKVLGQIEELNQKKEGKDKITINDVIIKAATTVLKNFPYLNAVYPEQGLILKKEVNVGIVMGFPDGLIIPVLKNCDGLSLEAISSGVRNLRKKAESGKFSSADFAGGTFSISNLGMLGVTDFAAIIYPPQTAILAVSAIKDTPVMQGGSFILTKVMKVTLSVDHRVVDGITAANFLRDLKKYLETEDLDVMEKPCCVVEDD
ncbi:MAG: 2-oxo acid dehydrogenase subunit E2 [Deltaproteobacteria bacterium]|nr:2-oxo acid dehydrogenase subunit E2 [Deltaproteobacteria bacterium]MBW2182921.1 2-oxo acid dehydrogenase subunit E2 [Deltaproteobacteria bacterium]